MLFPALLMREIIVHPLPNGFSMMFSSEGEDRAQKMIGDLQKVDSRS
jgi:hypothetical protein